MRFEKCTTRCRAMLVNGEVLTTMFFIIMKNSHIILFPCQLNLQCVEERMRRLINNLIRLSKQVCFSFFVPAEQEFSCIIYFLTSIQCPCASGLMLKNQDTTLLLLLMFGNKLLISIRSLGKNGKRSRLRQKSSGS